MLRFTKTAGQAIANLTQQMRLPNLAKQHGHELIPAPEFLRALPDLGRMNRFKELTSQK
jgi:hypothetical protein